MVLSDNLSKFEMCQTNFSVLKPYKFYYVTHSFGIKKHALSFAKLSVFSNVQLACMPEHISMQGGNKQHMSHIIRKPGFCFTTTKVQIRCAVNAQLISTLFSL